MMFFRSSNPALSRVRRMNSGAAVTDRATYTGIAVKSIYFVLLTLFSAAASFFGSIFLIGTGNTVLVAGLLIGSLILALITGFVAMNPNATKIAGSIYAVSEGFVVGFIAMMFYAIGYSGEVFAALFSTIGVFAAMMVLYSTGIIRVGSGFKKFMMSALIGIIFVNLIMFITSLFSSRLSTLFYGNGFLSIGISVIMVVLASLMILLDLNRMTEIVNAGLDKKYEWVASFGLLITLVWLYMEFLKLFTKLSSRKR